MRIRVHLLAALSALLSFVVGPFAEPVAWAAETHSEASLVLPDLGTVSFLGMPGSRLLLVGILVCLAGMVFGLVIYQQLKRLAVHRSMKEISELIYETCKTYLITQGKFILVL